MKNIALIVDDVELNREILIDMLEDSYECMEAEDGEEAIELMEKFSDRIAIVLLDLVMPKCDGSQVLEKMNQTGWINTLPVLVISSDASLSMKQKCFSDGVFDYIQKPFDRLLVLQRIKNATESFSYKNNLEEKVNEQTRELRAQNEKLNEINEKVIELLGAVVEARNLESGFHIKRVKEYTRILAGIMAERYPETGLTPHRIELIVAASPLHDIGKIMITDAILLKPAKLTPTEYEYMKTHTTCGYDLLRNANNIWNEEYNLVCLEVARYHHERWDGKGYPEGLKGDAIPISAQLVSIADVYDALVTDRPYKKAFTSEKAYQMILNGECGKFNPKLIECFITARPAMEEFMKQTKAVPVYDFEDPASH